MPGSAPRRRCTPTACSSGFCTGTSWTNCKNVEDPEESDCLLRLGLHRFPRERFPQLRAVASELATYDGAPTCTTAWR